MLAPAVSKSKKRLNTYRFVPGSDRDTPLTQLWRIWTQGSDVYAQTNGESSTHISVHKSGEIHRLMNHKQIFRMADLRPIGSSEWHHAFELRFLVDERSLRPYGQLESLNGQSADVFVFPPGFCLIATLLISATNVPRTEMRPSECRPHDDVLWSRRLDDGRYAVLVGTGAKLEGQFLEQLMTIRALRPTIIFDRPPTGRVYMEAHHTVASVEGHNVLTIVPMADDQIRLLADPRDNPVAPDEREVLITASASRASLDNQVATIEIPAVRQLFSLPKNLPTTIELGLVTLRVGEKLIAGKGFQLKPHSLNLDPVLAGIRPRIWQYPVGGTFDGNSLLVTLPNITTALRSEGAGASGLVREDEEVVMTIPAKPLEIVATLDRPIGTAMLTGQFTLRPRLPQRWPPPPSPQPDVESKD